MGVYLSNDKIALFNTKKTRKKNSISQRTISYYAITIKTKINEKLKQIGKGKSNSLSAKYT